MAYSRFFAPSKQHTAAISILIVLAFVGCLIVAGILHEPVPRIHDEFSYLLMGETFAHGRFSNPPPPLSEFFDTFHELITPVHASKYFPAQGIFLAVGKRLTGHPVVGVWLSSALACAAVTWMLQAWVSPAWGLLGGILFAVQYGIFSYWSQTYWGGMAAALGGALVFGAIRRLWDFLSWHNTVWLALGVLLLANSRPLEGLLSCLPVTACSLKHFYLRTTLREQRFWLHFVLPMLVIIVPGAILMGFYNRTITGSMLKSPYMLHEQQYQESPPFLFLQRRNPLSYTSYWLGAYYEGHEMQTYVSQRNLKLWPLAVARKIATWWDFYCGALLSIPLFLPAILRCGTARWFQICFISGLFLLPLISDHAIVLRILIDLLFVLEVGILWIVFSGFWERLAITTCAVLLLEVFFAKWSFPHYFAPSTCLVLYLQANGLRRIWDWEPGQSQEYPLSRAKRRRRPKSGSIQKPAFNLRWLVYAIPAACMIWLVLRVEGRIAGWWPDDPHGLDRETMLTDDWSVDRANINRWLDQQQKPQLVFVRYSIHHNVIYEWVYNHADIMHSHVIWARDLGTEHNKLLLNLLPDRTVWLLEADDRHPQLQPYEEAPYSPSQTAPIAHRPTPPDQSE